MEFAATLSILSVKDEYIFHFDIPTRSPALGTIHAPFNLLAKKAIDAQAHSRLSAEIKAAAEMLRHLYPAPHQAAQSSPLLATGSLRRLGYQLFDLLPFSIQQALVNLPLNMPLILRTDEFSLPWELLHDGEQWLTLKRPVGWCLLSEALPKSLIQRGQRADASDEFLVISNPTGDLREADHEAEWLFDAAELEFMYPRLLRGSGASRAQVLNALASGQYPIIHYSGHAKGGALVLADGELTAEEIQKELRGQPFIFLNACSSAADEPLREASNMSHPLQGLAQAFILGGASGVVGTLWPVFDVTSRQFAQTFYPLVLKSGFSIGEALLQARLEMYQARPNDPLWASFVLVGDPTLKLVNSLPPETRSVTLLVAHLSGLSSLFKQFDLDSAVEIQEEVITLLREVSERYEARFHAPMRHTLNVYFGIPKAHGDDAALALHAAFEMLERLVKFNKEEGEYLPVPLRLRIGISTGRVLAHLKAASDADYQIAGQVTNIAAALANQAQRGQIMVDKATSQSARKRFSVQPLTSLTIDEGDDLTPFYRVIDAQPKSVMTPMIGRENKMQALRQQWQRAKDGQGAIVGLEGDPGVGKTRLMQAFQQQISDEHQWISATCYRDKAQYSLLAPIIGTLAGLAPDDEEATKQDKLEQLLRTVGELTPREINQGLALLGRVVGLPFSWPEVDNLDAKQRQIWLARVFEAILESQAAEQAIVLVLEDLQWVDEASLKVLDQVVNAVGGMRLLLLALYQPHCSHNWGHSLYYRKMPLDELPKEAQRRLLTSLLGHKPTEELAQAILKQTGGNPLFIEEYVCLLQEDAFLTRQGNAWVQARDLTEMPHSDKVEQVIQARLDRLTTESRQVIQRAAVIGEKFEESVLSEIQGEPQRKHLNQDLRMLIIRRLIRQAGRWPHPFYAFHHGSVHKTVYDFLRKSFRQTTHRLVAEVLRRLRGDNVKVDELAYHYYHSNERLNAIRYCLRAAKLSTSEWANQTALAWYEQTLEKIKSFQQQPASEKEEADATPAQLIEWHVEALEGRAEVQSVIGESDEAMAAYQQALTLAADMPITRRADLYRKLAMVYDNKGQFELAREALNKGLEILDGLICLEAGRIHVYMGMIHYRQGQMLLALASCEQGIAIIEETESIRDLAQAYNLQGIVNRHLGKSQRAIKAYERSMALYKQAQYLPGQEYATCNLGYVYQCLGKWDVAEGLFRKSHTLSQRMGKQWREAVALNNLGSIHYWKGELEEAILAYSEARQIWQESGHEEFVAMALLNLGMSYLKQGTQSEADTYLKESLLLCQRLEAKRHFSMIYRHLAELELLREQLDDALPFAQEALDWALELKLRAEEGPARRVLGQAYRELGSLSSATTQLEESLTILEEQENPYETALTLEQLALLHKALTNAKEDNSALQAAYAYCERAIAIFGSLGAALDLERLQKIHRSL